MNRGIARVLPLAAILVLAACSGGSINPSLNPQNSSANEQSAVAPPDALTGPASREAPFVGANPVRRLCPTSVDPQLMECLAMVRTDVAPTLSAGADLADPAKTCIFTNAYCPVDLQSAYALPSLSKGAGRLVAIVDAWGYHHAASDLAYYRKAMGLKACGTGTKCLRIVNQNGNPSPLPRESGPSDDWKGEQSLDLDMVSAICPNCKILLVQTDNNYTSSLYAGVKTAGRLGAKYVGASWGGPESGGDNSIFHQRGVVIVAAAGDNGGGGHYGGPQEPCSYTYVVCAGGTRLVPAHNARGWSESVWNDLTFDRCGFGGSSPCGATGSGCSRKIVKPSWQHDTLCHMRSESDVSATASLRNPVAVYNSEEPGGGCPTSCWFGFGGTSASTQIISGVYALAGNAATQAGAQNIWRNHTGHMSDVTVGNNIDPGVGVTCASTIHYICYARIGFDGPTGWGSPKGLGAF
ncbi:MAG TPA: S8 family serine peptidase [Candidatus Binatia bacterium]|nr:S8 family serine peptidase [Candidatus Binatia bacterium]